MQSRLAFFTVNNCETEIESLLIWDVRQKKNFKDRRLTQAESYHQVLSAEELFEVLLMEIPDVSGRICFINTTQLFNVVRRPF